MKKLNKKLELNKKIISNLNDLKGGESVNTVNAVVWFVFLYLMRLRLS